MDPIGDPLRCRGNPFNWALLSWMRRDLASVTLLGQVGRIQAYVGGLPVASSCRQGVERWYGEVGV